MRETPSWSMLSFLATAVCIFCRAIVVKWLRGEVEIAESAVDQTYREPPNHINIDRLCPTETTTPLHHKTTADRVRE